ncbi:osmotically-inducible protein OsmY [Hydrogenispora ethanolica]|uniref:Osmotically-inducible protein OsmY n=1 Tax=Hydrogenispora ethanolica TaxID=1082276 RepID=A0A4R1S2A2_HYDET|nr:BON domain-containing protein [Hydrogenispora ethanolica]TCL73303.1 osmotically-inducible protein OsmY [Hydrogenispora ethanolica]
MKQNGWGELGEQIKRSFAAEPRLAGYGLKARVYGDGMVQIQGIVDVLDEKDQAEELVRKLPGVTGVANDITVCTDGAVDDEDVAFEVSEELRADPQIPDSVGFKVSGGEVDLVGSVASKSEMDRALETAAKARGVREVRSRLKLAEEVDDATITNNVQAAFMAEPELPAGRVRALTRDGVVTLWGNVGQDQVELAMTVAAGVPGVRKVNNGFHKSLVEVDDRIVTRMMDRIAANPYLNEQPIAIGVADGKIHLSGKLDTVEGKRDIDELIGAILDEFHLPGAAIDNKLRLEPDEK